MAEIDIAKLLQEVSPDNPCGENLEEDAALWQLEQATKPKPPPEFGPDRDKPPEPPDWREVQNQALALLSRSKDLQLAIYLTMALLHNRGLSGLSDGLALIKNLLQKYWNTLYPQLDPEDNNDPTMRINLLQSLCDREAMLASVREAPLLSSSLLGKISLKDIEIAKGVREPTAESEGNSLDMASIDAAFAEGKFAELQGTAAAVRNAINDVTAIETYLTNQVGVANAPSLEALVQVLKEIAHVFSERLAGRDNQDQLPSPAPELANEQRAELSPMLNNSAEPKPQRGEITCREDVTRQLDKICEYYQRHEPSSPVPILLQRARRLVAKDFMEILRDLAPNGVAQAELIQGVEKEPPKKK